MKFKMGTGVAKAVICFALAVWAFAVGPAAADDYDRCYKKIKREFGPYTDITWMEKVWQCTGIMADPNAEKAKAKTNGECNFDKRVGSCKGRIKVDSTSGSKGNYAAEITVSSSAASCSKVEYFLDNTPYTTILKAGNEAGESVFGTSKISKNSFSIDKCTTYESQ